MKKNFLIAVAVAALMLATTVAQAADVSFSGQFRPRWQSSEDFDDTTNARNYVHDTRSIKCERKNKCEHISVPPVPINRYLG